MPIRVFVYGTLKQGHGNNRLLENAKFLGRCYIEGPWRLVSLGAYPGLVELPKVEHAKVLGEVYQVDLDTLQSLDWLEGHPRYYRRDKVATPWKNACAYFLPEQYAEKYPQVDQVWEPSEAETEFMKGVSCGL